MHTSDRPADGGAHDGTHDGMPLADQRAARTDGRLLIAVLVLMFIAAGLALSAVQHPRPPVEHRIQPSPFGYSWSTALFVLPGIALCVWLLRHPLLRLQRKAFLIGSAMIIPIWCGLDIVLGRTFFVFPNAGATLGINAWGWKPGEGWATAIPIEEFVFYVGGVIAIQLCYIWSSESWLSAYRVPDATRRLMTGTRLHRPHWGAIGVGAVLFMLAWVYKAYVAQSPGIPGYFLFLLISSLIPVGIFFRVVRPFINWQAFAYTMTLLVLVSLLWEVTLGLPYGYWDYNTHHMVGIFVRPWNNLPVEEPVLWVTAAWINVILYELIYFLLATGQPIRRVLMPRSGTTT
jgi:hypothetical protein